MNPGQVNRSLARGRVFREHVFEFVMPLDVGAGIGVVGMHGL